MSDYYDPVRQAVEQYLTENETVISAVAAKELIDTILPPEMITDWLWRRRYETLTSYITQISRMTGARDAHDAHKGVFARAADALEDALEVAAGTGNSEPVQEFFKMWHCANEDGQPVRKRLGDMNKTEVSFVKKRAEANVRYYERRIRFLELLTEHLDDGQVVSDVYSASDLQIILDSIT